MLGPIVQSPSADHLQNELVALSALAQRVASGENMVVDDYREFSEGSTTVSVFMLPHELDTYLMTIEETDGEMLLTIRSLSIEELYIKLPSPLMVSIQEGVSVVVS